MPWAFATSNQNASLVLETGAHRIEHPLIFGKLARFQLRVDQLVIDGDLEAASAGRNELETLNLLLVRTQQLARQTDGLRLVVSHRAILQLQVHDLPPYRLIANRMEYTAHTLLL